MEPTWFSGESICVLAQMRLNNVEKKKKGAEEDCMISSMWNSEPGEIKVWFGGAYVDIKNCIEKL